jgi:hypothetical protein
MVLSSPNAFEEDCDEGLQAHEVEGVDHGGELDCVLDDEEPDADADAAHEAPLYHLAVHEGKQAAAHCLHLSALVAHEGQGQQRHRQEAPAVLRQSLVLEVGHQPAGDHGRRQHVHQQQSPRQQRGDLYLPLAVVDQRVVLGEVLQVDGEDPGVAFVVGQSQEDPRGTAGAAWRERLVEGRLGRRAAGGLVGRLVHHKEYYKSKYYGNVCWHYSDC